MWTEEYSIIAVATESKTSYCGSELEIGLEEKRQHKEKKVSYVTPERLWNY